MKKYFLASCLGLIALFGATPVDAQEIVYRPVNPGFGGNPFNSDYLLGTATAQRPERKGEDEELSETELFARQIQSRLLSSLSSSLVEAITGADPGTSGEFTVGDQTIFFERTLTEIRLTIRNNETGETTEIVVPVLDFDSSQAGSALAQQAPSTGSSATTPGGSSIFNAPPIESGSLQTKPLGL